MIGLVNSIKEIITRTNGNMPLGDNLEGGLFYFLKTYQKQGNISYLFGKPCPSQ